MRVLITILLAINIFAGVGDSAGGGTKSLQALIKEQNKKYYLDIPSYEFDNGMSLSVHLFCEDGDTVRSIKKYATYKPVYTRRGDQYTYERTGEDFVRRAIVPADDRDVVELEGKIEVSKLIKSGNNKSGIEYKKGKKLFDFEYSIPRCSDLE